jgi:hypothetical protein
MLGNHSGSGPGGIPGDGDPGISGLTPSTVAVGAGATTITVHGNDFVAGSVIEVGAVVHTTTFVSSTELTTSYTPTVPGTVNVTVRNPDTSESNDFPFVVT